MRVVIYEINKGQKSHYYGLKQEDGTVLYSCPQRRTIAGIVSWAFKHGYIVTGIEEQQYVVCLRQEFRE